MPEKAILAPLTSEEIIEIAVEEFRRRLRSLGPLQGMKEYAGFEIGFHHDIRLFRMATNGGGDKETLAWGKVLGGETGADAEPAGAVSDIAAYKSDPDVNEERLKHNMPLTVETGDGKGGKIRKKMRVKDAE
jgi:hypothetical protein